MVEDSIGHRLIESEVSKVVVSSCCCGMRSTDVERKGREATVRGWGSGTKRRRSGRIGSG